MDRGGTRCAARGTGLVLTLLAACTTQPRGGTPTRAQAAPPPATGPAVIDGFVVWPRSLAEAPPAVRERLELVTFGIETFRTAPRPSVDYQTQSDAWHRSVEASAGHFAVLEQRIQAWLRKADAHDAAVAPMPYEERQLYFTVVRLIEESTRARYLTELRIGPPAFGSCTNSPDEELGDALHDTLELAEDCVRLAAAVTGPLGSNAPACRRRGEWTKPLIATGREGVCEPPPKPGR